MSTYNNVIRQVSEEHIYGIIDLFNNNYNNNYHYEDFLSPSKIKALLNTDRFKGWVAASENGKVIGFSGLYIEKNNSIKNIKLAHLLVDDHYRGNGIGNLLENARENYYSQLDESHIVRVSCVEKPVYSIKLKKKRGFSILGLRLAYRPVKGAHRTNSVLMGLLNIKSIEYNASGIEKPSEKTCHLISTVCRSTGVQRNFLKRRGKFLCNYELSINGKLGRAVAKVSYKEKGVPIQETIDKLKSSSCSYKAILVDAQSYGFAQIDHELNEQQFFPVAYIPNFGGGTDCIEYQFIDENITSEEYQMKINELLTL